MKQYFNNSNEGEPDSAYVEQPNVKPRTSMHSRKKFAYKKHRLGSMRHKFRKSLDSGVRMRE